MKPLFILGDFNTRVVVDHKSVLMSVKGGKNFRGTVYNPTTCTLGKKISKSADWFEAHLTELTPVMVKKRKTLAAYKFCLSEWNLQVLQAVCSKVQQSARCCVNAYWFQLCSRIQTAADRVTSRGCVM